MAPTYERAEPLSAALGCLGEERFDDAILTLGPHLAREPDDAVACCILGVALCRSGRVRSGLAALERAHYLNPSDARILYNYGLALEAAGRKAEAWVRYRAARRLAPTYQPPQRRLEHLEAAHGRVVPGEDKTRDAEGNVVSVRAGYPKTEEGVDTRLSHAGRRYPWWSVLVAGIAMAVLAGVAAAALAVGVGWLKQSEGRGASGPGRPVVSLEGAQLAGAALAGANLRAVNLRAANLEGADLKGAVLEGADLSEAYLTRAVLTDCRLRGARLQSTRLLGARLPDADLRDADLRGAYLKAAIFTRADLQRADLRLANLAHAGLSLAVLRDADLRGANLNNADLSGADLHGADLRGADLRRTHLRNSRLMGARYDRSTRWPAGAELRRPRSEPEQGSSGTTLAGAAVR